jgi:ABC-type multidrug transport system fused ATPase/permease subunit
MTTTPTSRPVTGWTHLRAHLQVHWRALTLAAVASIAATVLAVVQPLFVRRVVDAVGLGEPTTGLVAALLAITFGAAVVAGVQAYLLQRAGESVVLELRSTLVRRMLRMPIREFDQRRLGDLMSRIGTDTTLIRTVVTSGLFTLVSSTLMFVGAVVVMVRLDAVLFGITLGSVALGAVVIIGIGRRMRAVSLEAQTQVGVMSAAVERSLSAVRTIRAAGATEREGDAVVRTARGAYGSGLRLARLAALIQPVSSVSIQGVFVLVLIIGGSRVNQGAMSLGDLMAFILYLFMLVNPISQALQAYTQIQSGLAALDRVMQIVSIPVEGETTAGRVPVPAAPAEPDEAVRFDDVHFSYVPGQPVLRGLDLVVRRGSTTAVVGPSGTGKSTILGLLERFYDVDSGSIRVAGRDVRELDHAELRRQFAYVEQDSPALAGSIGDNVRLGRPGASDAEVLDALRAVRLHELVERSPDGLDTEIGDGGVMLSGGQRQRLAWARVLISDAPVLLLDEPTSSVDSETESVLQCALDRAARGRTVIVVAHRLATIVDADAIVVLDEGRVSSVGTHRELLEDDAGYRDLAARQLLAGTAVGPR